MINVNGKIYHGNNISIVNGKVTIDGKRVEDSNEKTINIQVDGNIQRLDVDSCERIIVNGNVGEATSTSGDLEIKGNVEGNVKSTSGDIECGDVKGNVSTISGDVERK